MGLASNRTIAFLLVITAIAAPSITLATNGYFLIGYGAKSRSMGGVGVAYGQDGLAAGANPATMVDVGTRIDLGGEYFGPKRGFVHDSATLESGFPGSNGPVNHRSESNVFLIPSMGAVYKFNRQMSVGLAVIGNGANTRYDQKVPGLPGCLDGNQVPGQTGSTAFNFNCLGEPTVGASLLQMQMLPSLAYNVTKEHTIGASLAIGVQQFRAYGLGAFGALGFSSSNEDLTNQGNDYSYGAGVRLGYMGKFFKKRLTIGANWASKVYMTRFDKYQNLFAENGKFNIPEHRTVGFALKATKQLTIAGDFQRIKYGDIRAVANCGPNAADPNSFFTCGTTVTGFSNGLGFGWEDQNVYKIGINYDYNKQFSFRAGYNYGKTPIQDEEVLFNFLAPAVNEQHVTLGASYRPSRNSEWSFNYMHAFSNTVKGPTVFGPQSGLPVNGENASIDLKINSFGIAFGYKL